MQIRNSLSLSRMDITHVGESNRITNNKKVQASKLFRDNCMLHFLLIYNADDESLRFPEVYPHHVVLHLPPEEHPGEDSESTGVRHVGHFFLEGGGHVDVGGALQTGALRSG